MPRLNGERALHARKSYRDPLEILQAFHVPLEGLAPRARSFPREHIGGGHEMPDDARARLVIVMRSDGIHNECVLAVLAGQATPGKRVTTLRLVTHRLAD